MVQILVQLPEEMVEQLERVAPGSSRQRSRFIRLAIQKALMEVQEEEIREAYRQQPDEDVFFDPKVWGVAEPKAASRKKRK